MKLKDKKSFIKSVKYCLDGLKYILVHERNFKIELFIGIIVIIFGFIFKLTKIEFIIVLMLIFLVLSFEIINTAIEKTLDIYTKEYNKDVKIIKDISAFAVLLVSLLSLIVGIIIFTDKL